ncbi:peroxiredoxin family protein [Candidatus Poribacteria bacterium]|nr:peroxiredoxin family protein [Candidatus Poribacteria bacterium]MYB63520.1 peroxiredoxin family protein [Candidatus Poribacteria bacterium]MYF55114.1 peroxiredoxin family protein [Candidatus Poribacteria bacterium]MYI95035.1 peroxiredoxin family protein [Candidatus Poribacteria bacterium]
MQNGYTNIINAGAVELIAISINTQWAISRYVQSHSPDFIMLADSDLLAIGPYNVKSPDLQYANPTAYIINAEGKVAWIDNGARYGHRTTSSQIVAALNGL